MITETIDLYGYFNIKRSGGVAGYLSVYAREENPDLNKKIRPAMLVIPGGGYCSVSKRESEPVALEYLLRGFSSFVLNYSTETAYPVPLIEACMAVAYIRENAERYSVDVGHIAAIGFSAGGHLAAMLANIYDEKEVKAVLGKRTENVRLNAVILAYPVISTGEYTHKVTKNVITSGSAELEERLSIEKRVTNSSVPAFIWHTFEDDCVPVENSLLLAAAYKRAGVPFSLHIFEKGAHGLSLCSLETNNQTDKDLSVAHAGEWLNLSAEWLASRGFCVKQ